MATNMLRSAIRRGLTGRSSSSLQLYRTVRAHSLPGNPVLHWSSFSTMRSSLQEASNPLSPRHSAYTQNDNLSRPDLLEIMMTNEAGYTFDDRLRMSLISYFNRKYLPNYSHPDTSMKEYYISFHRVFNAAFIMHVIEIAFESSTVQMGSPVASHIKALRSMKDLQYSSILHKFYQDITVYDILLFIEELKCKPDSNELNVNDVAAENLDIGDRLSEIVYHLLCTDYKSLHSYNGTSEIDMEGTLKLEAEKARNRHDQTLRMQDQRYTHEKNGFIPWPPANKQSPQDAEKKGEISRGQSESSREMPFHHAKPSQKTIWSESNTFTSEPATRGTGIYNTSVDQKIENNRQSGQNPSVNQDPAIQTVVDEEITNATNKILDRLRPLLAKDTKVSSDVYTIIKTALSDIQERFKKNEVEVSERIKDMAEKLNSMHMTLDEQPGVIDISEAFEQYALENLVFRENLTEEMKRIYLKNRVDYTFDEEGVERVASQVYKKVSEDLAEQAVKTTQMLGEQLDNVKQRTVMIAVAQALKVVGEQVNRKVSEFSAENNLMTPQMLSEQLARHAKRTEKVAIEKAAETVKNTSWILDEKDMHQVKAQILETMSEEDVVTQSHLRVQNERHLEHVKEKILQTIDQKEFITRSDLKNSNWIFDENDYQMIKNKVQETIAENNLVSREDLGEVLKTDRYEDISSERSRAYENLEINMQRKIDNLVEEHKLISKNEVFATQDGNAMVITKENVDEFTAQALEAFEQKLTERDVVTRKELQSMLSEFRKSILDELSHDQKIATAPSRPSTAPNPPNDTTKTNDSTRQDQQTPEPKRSVWGRYGLLLSEDDAVPTDPTPPQQPQQSSTHWIEEVIPLLSKGFWTKDRKGQDEELRMLHAKRKNG